MDSNLAPDELMVTKYITTMLNGNIDRQFIDEIRTIGDAVAWSKGEPPADVPSLRDYQTPNVALRPLVPADFGSLYSASLSTLDSYSWRFRGTTVPPDRFEDLLYRGVVSQFGVVERSTGSLVGLVACYEAVDNRHHGKIAIQRVRDVSRSPGLVLEGGLVFLTYLFDVFPLHKVYLELPEYNSGLIAGMARRDLAVLEGRFRNHVYWRDEWHDCLTYAIYRTSWTSFLRSIEQALSPENNQPTVSSHR